jgi:hypothetical protein
MADSAMARANESSVIRFPFVSFVGKICRAGSGGGNEKSGSGRRPEPLQSSIENRAYFFFLRSGRPVEVFSETS